MHTEPLASTLNPHVQGYFLGVFSACALAASAFFLKFWKQTRDSLFLCFGISFLIEAINHFTMAFAPNPSHSSPAHYMVRTLAALIILGAILRKNYGRQA